MDGRFEFGLRWRSSIISTRFRASNERQRISNWKWDGEPEGYLDNISTLEFWGLNGQVGEYRLHKGVDGVADTVRKWGFR